jgi:prepilin-type N-terminal cleavage/methylation domain-containing protein
MAKKVFTPLDKNKATTINTYLTGFTLIEILISVLIMSLLMAGLVSVFIAGKRHILHNRSKLEAAELGGFFLAPLQSDVRQDQWNSNCVGSNTGCPASPTNDVTIDKITYKPTIAVSTNFSGTLSKVKLTITWNEPTS